jgi:VanZ family protein
MPRARRLFSAGSSAGWALVAVAWALLVWWLLTFEPPSEAPLAVDWLPVMVLPWTDKLAHAALFFVQALFVERAAVERCGGGRALLLAFAVCLVLGGATELRQRSVPHRDADVADFAANVAGAVAAAAALPLSRRRRARALA